MSERVLTPGIERSDAAAVAGASDRRTLDMIAGISRGEPAALAAFYEAWFDRGYDIARSITRRDESFCLDVVQEAMLKVIRGLKPSLGIRNRRSLEAWFVRVVHTTAIDLLRRESRRAVRERSRGSGSRGGAGAAECVAIEEQIAWVTGELGRLEAEDASLVALRVGSGKSLEEIGTAAGMSAGSVHGRVRRLLERVRRVGKEKFHE